MLRSLINGLVGACTMTVAHQLLKRAIPDAPRLDVLGVQSLQKLTKSAGLPESVIEHDIFKKALIGDILTNTLYFSQVGGKPGIGAVLKGLSLGVTAGVGAVALPNKLGLNGKASSKTDRTAILTVALYSLGGLAAAGAAQLISSKEK